MNHVNPSSIQRTFTPINLAIYFICPISSTKGSPSLTYRQTLLAGRIFSSAGVLIGAELFLLIAKYLFKLEFIPILDLPTKQIIQMPIKEFYDFVRAFTSEKAGSTIPSASSAPSSLQSLIPGSRGFESPLPPEAPLVITLAVTADFSNNPYSPYATFFLPIIALPGIRGALPILILGILGTIFVRTVVAPETTGAKPLPKTDDQPNSSIKFSPEELLQFLSRFGKYFSP